MHWRTALVVLSMITAAGCSRQSTTASPPPPAAAPSPTATAWTPVAPADMSPEQKAEQARCVEAVKTLGKRLVGRLGTALDTGDPAAAVEVCRTEASKITAEVGQEYGLRIGRTSFRLRNPANAPPPWARPLVDERVAGPAWLAGPDGALAGLLPIRLKPECGMCHGPKEEIPEEVRSALAEHYPGDQATGFHPGDLRGWFWVETGPER